MLGFSIGQQYTHTRENVKNEGDILFVLLIESCFYFGDSYYSGYNECNKMERVPV